MPFTPVPFTPCLSLHAFHSYLSLIPFTPCLPLRFLAASSSRTFLILPICPHARSIPPRPCTPRRPALNLAAVQPREITRVIITLWHTCTNALLRTTTHRHGVVWTRAAGETHKIRALLCTQDVGKRLLSLSCYGHNISFVMQNSSSSMSNLEVL